MLPVRRPLVSSTSLLARHRLPHPDTLLLAVDGRRCYATPPRTSASPSDSSIVSREDLGVIEYRSPRLRLPIVNPLALVKELAGRLYHRSILTLINRRRFNKAIAPDSVSMDRLELLAGEVRHALLNALREDDVKKVRYLCGTSAFQSRLVRACKRRTGAADALVTESTATDTGTNSGQGKLVSFQAQAVNEARTQLLTQAAVRFPANDGNAHDYILQARSWMRPVTWTLQDVRTVKEGA